MAHEDRGTDPPLIQRLLKKPYSFAFFQAVHLLEHYVSSVRESEPLGHKGPAESEAVRFKAEPSLAFPLSDVVDIKKIDKHDIHSPLFQMTVSFLGLYGPASPLPDFYTEDILRDDPDESFVEVFLDVFHHRILSLFYRCWVKYRYYLQFSAGGRDDFSQRIFSLMGLGTEELKERLQIEPVEYLRYTGLFTQQGRSAAALEGILSDYFGGVPVHIEQCIERWVAIEDEDRMALGVQGCGIAENAVVGERVADRSGKFRVSIKLAKLPDFIRFLPDGDYFRALEEITLLFLHAPLEFEEELVLSGNEVPGVCLSLSGNSRLGWTSWLISGQPEESASVVFKVA